MSAFVAVWDREECVTLVTVDPRHSGAAVVQHPGSRHPISAGAPGIAIQSAFAEQEWEALAPGIPYRPEAAESRRRGFAASHDEVIPGVSSIAVPLRVPGGRPAALAVVYIRAAQDPDKVAGALTEAARRIEAQLG
jgi:DNA-binding IclR family transcriptional regulator